MKEGEIHIHAPKPTAKKIFSSDCPDCNKHSKFLTFFTPWYGWDTTCIKCGRNWIDGVWMDLTWERQSRQKSVARAKELWRELPPTSENHFGIEE
jgi:hypothetical protein